MKSARCTVAGEACTVRAKIAPPRRLVEPAQLLHGFGGQSDLVARDLTPAGRAEQPVHLVLDVVCLRQGGRRQLAAQPLEPPTQFVPLEDMPRDPRDLRPVCHDALPFGSSAAQGLGIAVHCDRLPADAGAQIGAEEQRHGRDVLGWNEAAPATRSGRILPDSSSLSPLAAASASITRPMRAPSTTRGRWR